MATTNTEDVKYEIVFEVKRVLYRNSETRFAIADVEIKKHPKDIEKPTAVEVVRGIFPAIHEKDEFKALGKWEDTGRNGFQFIADQITLIFPETSKGIMDFLSRNVEGVGKAFARKIVEEFKENTFTVLLRQPEKMLSIKGVSQAKADKIHELVASHVEFEEVMLYFVGLGMSHTDSSYIYSEYGYSGITKITDNPYILAEHKRFTFKTIDSLAASLTYMPNNHERVKMAVVKFIEYQMSARGDMFVFRKTLDNNINWFLDTYGADAFKNNNKIDMDELDTAIEELQSIYKIKIEYDKDKKPCVYLHYFNFVENQIVKLLTKMKDNFSKWICDATDLDAYLRDYELKSGLILAQNQRKAVHMALMNRFSILSGGPGTGKTQTINTILQAIKNFKPGATIELCAPTGKAAKRMTEITGIPAKTIHRLIGLQTTDVDFEMLIPIESDYLIVDESSMVDAFMFSALLSTISENTTVLLVGDYEQLPSVGPGLILRDLIASDVVPTTILNEIFRQASYSQIVTNCHKLIEGKDSKSQDGLTFDPKRGDFFFIENKHVEKIVHKIMESTNRLLSRGIPLDDIQILSSSNKGDLGVDELNRRFQSRYNPKNPKVRGNQIEVRSGQFLRVNDRVMQTINNYDLNVFNGETGKIESMNLNSIVDISEFEMVVNFGDRDITYTYEFLTELKLAYAITIHKSQGSEFKNVIMPIHPSLNVPLSRNIVYTAWSRAKERMICIGDVIELDKAVSRIENTARNSQIKEKLRRAV